ncbi:N-acetyltransferase [Paracoccus onubensis]|uniref:GNAT family N-acetyltransferase n=1 Tax=Paracoccus onubensis TaxID=1675788 RepID=UPI0027308CF3|nr:N-acetyltransferase [Paracoccus onubensis]MDP0928629.1 N-acetyltransferase [Paracoccus onubensis]
MKIRQEIPADQGTVRQITEDAFATAEHSSGTEGAIIDALRDTGSLTLSLVAEIDGQVVGHIAFSPVTVAGNDVGWFGLGPVAIRPDLQGQGIGGNLIRKGLTQLRAQGARGCVVLGSPGYYTRFGFAQDASLVFEGVPPEYFMSQVFCGKAPAGAVVYQPAFYSA